MKQTLILVLSILLLIAASCNSPERQLRHTAQKYLDATGEYNIDEACLYCTEETKTGLRTIEQTLMTMLDSSYIKQNTPARIKITSIEIIDDTSAIVAYHKKTPIEESDGTIKMRKRKGIWLTHMPIKVPSIIRQENQNINYDSLEAKIASGEIKFTRVKKK